MLRWEDAFDIRASKNVRGQNTYDVYRKGTEEMLAADVPAVDIDKFLKGLMGIVERAAEEELDALFVVDEEKKDA